MASKAISHIFRAALVSGVCLTAVAAHAQSLSVMQSEPPRSMDPADQTATFTQVVLSPLYEGLIDRDENFEIIPALATEWEPDESGLAWTFQLREGVTFHDGGALDADAVVANFERLLDEGRGLAAAGRFSTVVESVEAADDMAVTFNLHNPYAGFIDLLATSVGWIVSPDADAEGTVGNTAVGTGPFSFVEWASGEHVIVEAYEDYWGDPAELETITFTWSSEASVLSMAAQAGEADIVNPLPPVYAPAIGANPEIELFDEAGSRVFWVSLNVELEPLDDVRVRQALNYATDREALVQALLQGYGVAANSPLAPTNPAWDESLDPYPFDPERARELLEDAGVGDGFSMSVAVEEPSANIAEALQGMWSDIGVDLEVRRLESGIWSDAAFADPEGKADDNLHSTIASWSSGTFDADLQFRPLYMTESWSPAGANLGFYSNEEFDELVNRAAAESDADVRIELAQEAQQIINDEAPHVLLYYNRDLAAVNAGLEGVLMLPGGMIVVKGASWSE